MGLCFFLLELYTPKLSTLFILFHEYIFLQRKTPTLKLSKFLRRSLMIFIIKGFRTIVFIFIVISTTFQPICPPAFFRCLSNSGIFTELRTTSFIASTGGCLFWFCKPWPGTSGKYSCIVTRLQVSSTWRRPEYISAETLWK